MRLDIQMPLHLNKMMEGSVKILETINFQMGYLSELEYGIFSERLKAMNINLSHLNNTIIKGIYHPIENRSKRAPLDTGVKLLQGIFGVAATDKDVKAIEDRFRNSTKQLWISQNEVIIATNILKRSFMKLSDAIVDQNKMCEKYREKNYFRLKLMNTSNLVGESISMINVLMSECQNIITKLRKGFLPKNVVTDQILHEIIEEGLNKFAGTKYPGNNKGILSEMIKAITVHHTENSFKFILHVPFVSNNNFTFYNIVAVPIIRKNNELFLASEISDYIGIDNFFYQKINI